jgi:hypothetical protein
VNGIVGGTKGSLGAGQPWSDGRTVDTCGLYKALGERHSIVRDDGTILEALGLRFTVEAVEREIADA